MAYHQNTTVDSTKLIVGNCKIETSATVGGTYVNLGAGIVSAFTHTPTFYDVQAGNAPDPIEGVADEVCTVDFEMIEYDGSVLSAIGSGLFTHAATTTQSTLSAGGNSTITPRAFRITNTRIISSVTKQTVVTIPYATIKTGLTMNFKSDNDADPIAILPCQIEGTINSALTVGSQLFTVVRDL